jgi:hypothetical protein
VALYIRAHQQTPRGCAGRRHNGSVPHPVIAEILEFELGNVLLNGLPGVLDVSQI